MPRRVKIAPGHNQITLPDGRNYNAGQEVVLTDAQFAEIAASAIGDEVLDLGDEPVEGGGGGLAELDGFPGIYGFAQPEDADAIAIIGPTAADALIIANNQAMITSGGNAAVQGGTAASMALAGGPTISLDNDPEEVINLNADKLLIGTPNVEIDGAPVTFVPAGGLTGQVLSKTTDTDFDIQWAPGGGGSPFVFDNAWGFEAAQPDDPLLAIGFISPDTQKYLHVSDDGGVSAGAGGASLISLTPTTAAFGNATVPTAIGGDSIDLATTALTQNGTPLVGIPAGGTTGQVLSKATDDDRDVVWTDSSGGGGGAAIYGDGFDGDVTLPGGTTQLTRNMAYNNLTVPAGAILNPGGCVVYVKETLSVEAGGIITRSGGNASAGSGGAGASGQILLPTGSTGPNAPSNSPGNAGGTVTTGVGGNGGAGGTGASGSGGPAGTVTNLPTGGEGLVRSAMFAQTGRSPTSTSSVNGAAAGGSGGGDAGGQGGGGGAGGGMMSLIARQIINNGSIQANGGNGATPSGGNRGGGGGGGGGLVFCIYDEYSGNQPTVTPGTGGAGTGTGTAGGNGTAGRVIMLPNV